MARIAFFTERLPPNADPISNFSFELIRSLADQQHDIHVYSTYRPGAQLPPSHPQISIFLPFVKWSWLELPRLIPLLLDFRPEILHVIQPRAEALRGFTNAMSAIPGFAPLLGRPALVTSFYDLSANDLKLHKQLMSLSHAITVSNEPQRSLVSAYLDELERQVPISLLPVPVAGVQTDDRFSLAEAHSNRTAMDENLSHFLESSANMIFVPLSVSEHISPQRLFTSLAQTLVAAEQSIVVIGGGWGTLPLRERHRLMRTLESNNVGGRLLLTGALDRATEKRCLSRARVVFTASLPAESLELARIIRDALEASALLVMSQNQASNDPLAWRNGENALICSETASATNLTEESSHAPAQEWSETLLKALHSNELVEHIRHHLPEFSRIEAIDQPGNVVSRIYSNVLNHRRSGPRR